MSKKVEEQKGPIRDNMPTYRDMTYMERQIERHMQLDDIREGQKLHMMTPKQSKK